MNPFDAIAAPEVGATALAMLPRLALALVLGAAVAARPWRRRRPRSEMVQTQLLMCVAGALVASVIGDSLARAFGLVGLGGFIRFRSGLKDPRDAAALFVLIGLGMACGLGAFEVALAGWAFLLVVYFALDRYAERRSGAGTGRWRLTVEAEDVRAAEAAFAQALQAEGFTCTERTLDLTRGVAVLEVCGPQGVIETLRPPWEKARAIRWEKLEVAA